MEFVIENDMPMPTTRRGHPGKYPFRKLEIGQSFDCEIEAMMSAAYQYAKRNNVVFTVAKMNRDSKTVWRCKRIK